MWLHLHAFLTLIMSLYFWARFTIILQMKRMELGEKVLSLTINFTMAILFSFAFLDIFVSIPIALKLMNLVRGVKT